MIAPIVVVGAGGFGREALDVLEAVNGASESPVYEIMGVVDDGPNAEDVGRLQARDVRLLGGVEAWLRSGTRALFVIGVGEPAARRGVEARISDFDRAAATVVHPHAVVGSRATLGAGTIVCAGAQLSTNVSLGRHVHVNPNATIGHDATLGDFVSVNPAAVISGSVVVGDGVLLGSGSVILQGLTVGPDATVGAAACVVHSVGAGLTVKGVPAR